MIVEGLAYLSHSWLPVGGGDAKLCTDEAWGFGRTALLDAVNAIRDEGHLQQRLADAWSSVEPLRTGYFQKAMHAFAAMDGSTTTADATADLVRYARSVHLPMDAAEAAELLLQASLHIYVRTVGNDYFLLHGVTAAFSLVTLQPLLTPHAARASCRRFLLALLAAYVAQRQPSLCPLEASMISTAETNAGSDGVALASAWAVLRERAIAPTAEIRNEHVYKLVWLCCDRAASAAGQGEETRLLYAAARKALGASLTGRTGERPFER